MFFKINDTILNTNCIETIEYKGEYVYIRLNSGKELFTQLDDEKQTLDFMTMIEKELDVKFTIKKETHLSKK